MVDGDGARASLVSGRFSSRALDDGAAVTSRICGVTDGAVSFDETPGLGELLGLGATPGLVEPPGLADPPELVVLSSVFGAGVTAPTGCAAPLGSVELIEDCRNAVSCRTTSPSTR